jgi:serine/threonine-protein kinase
VSVIDVNEMGEPTPVSSAATRATGRTTVLPRRRRNGPAAAVESQPRFRHVRTLGEGAMGQVDLMRDNDIRRTVAVKKILKDVQSDDMLLRFADEIRVVGQLEHPGIVPIYDVGSGEDGQVYLVMKHLQGRTMEEIIESLKAGDAQDLELFTPAYRARLFLGVLDAIGYAHAKGILHRDIKPANVMIGPHGEVTVMDWGIARPIAGQAAALSVAALGETMDGAKGPRLGETQVGGLAGTPLYMSPEQAAGLNNELDQRSDIYSLCVTFYEWLVLRHPLQHVSSLPELLATLVLEDYSPEQLSSPAQAAGVPMEYVWVIVKGLAKDRAWRYQTVGELEAAIRAVHDGNIRIQCNITRAKNYAHRLSHWIDHNPATYLRLYQLARATIGVGLAAAIGFGLWRLILLLR